MPEIRGAGGGCFTGDTLVCTPNGQVPIKELQEGSEVISFDDKGITHVAKVLKVHVHENEKVYRMASGEASMSMQPQTTGY